MSIVDELKKLIVARGGSTANIWNIADAVKVLTQLEASNTDSGNTTEPETP